MARETVASRNARLARSQRDAYMEENRLAYPMLLMSTLERVSKLSNFNLTVRNGFFCVEDRNSRYESEYELGYSWSTDHQTVLENLIRRVEAIEEELAESRRRAEVRENALRKAQEVFSQEERELLGL